MPMVKLTGSNGAPIYINLDQIVSIIADEHGSLLRPAGNTNTIGVREKPEEILLQAGKTKR